MKKVDARSMSSSAQEHLRQLAVKAVLDGKKQRKLPSSLELHRKPSVAGLKPIAFRAQKPSNRNGKAARKEEPPAWQAAQIAKTVIDHHPEQLKLPFYLWTREVVGILIKRRFGIQLSVWTIGRQTSPGSHQ